MAIGHWPLPLPANRPPVTEGTECQIGALILIEVGDCKIEMVTSAVGSIVIYWQSRHTLSYALAMALQHRTNMALNGDYKSYKFLFMAPSCHRFVLLPWSRIGTRFDAVWRTATCRTAECINNNNGHWPISAIYFLCVL